MSFLSKLGGMLNPLKPVGSVLTAKAKSDAQSRGNQVQAQITGEDINSRNDRDYNDSNLTAEKMRTEQQDQLFRQLMDREKDMRASANDAYGGVLHSDYALQKQDYKPGSVSIMGKQVQIPSIIPGPKALSAGARTAIQGYQDEKAARLAPPSGPMNMPAPRSEPQSGGNTGVLGPNSAGGGVIKDPSFPSQRPGGYQGPTPGPMPTVDAIQRRPNFAIDPKLLKPGKLETIFGMGGALLNGLPDDNGGNGNSSARNNPQEMPRSIFDRLYPAATRGRIGVDTADEENINV